MSSLSSLYIKKETLKTLLEVVGKKGEKGVELTISINDETNEYGQNVGAWVSQSKEAKEAKKKRFFSGNGKVFWTDGIIKVGERKEQATQPPQASQPPIDENDLPF